MSGPKISSYENQFRAVLWSGLDCEIKGSGPIMKTLYLASALKIPQYLYYKNVSRKSEKKQFFRAKTSSVNA